MNYNLTYNKNARLEIRQYKNGTIYNYLQIYYVFPDGSENIFYRTWNSSGWNDWIRIAKVSDIPTIADNLTTNDATQVLSAKQGKVLADLIGDAISYINQ